MIPNQQTRTKELSRRIYDIVVEEVDAIYPQFMKRVNDIDLDYFENIVRDSEEMSKELNLELRDKVLGDIRQYAMRLLEKSKIKLRIEAIMKDADTATANEVFDNAKEQIRSYVYACSILNGSLDFTEEELQKMYTDAKKRDLWEYITQNNKSDVIKFYHALMDSTYEQCKDVLFGCIEYFLGTIETNPGERKNTEDSENGAERTFHCNDCGNTIYRHEVFCSKCGKLLDRYDFES